MPPVKNFWLGCVVSSVAGGFVLGVLKPWLFSFLESQVVLSRQGVNRNCYNGFSPILKIEFWPWQQVASYLIQKVAHDGRSFDVLMLYSHSGHELAKIGIASEVSTIDVAEFVEANLSKAQNAS